MSSPAANGRGSTVNPHARHGIHAHDAEFFKTTGLGTTFVHAGNSPDPVTGAVTTPISLATTYKQFAPGLHNGFEYSRSANPTRQKLEESIAAAEGANICAAFASGCAATAAVVHATCLTGDHILAIDDIYGGTQRYFRKQVMPIYGINVTFVDFDDEDAVRAAVIPGKTKLFWLETPTNPTLKVTSIKRIAELAHSAGALLAVDNTFMSPYLQQPLKHGADIVTHSCTKSISGHSDVVMGAVCVQDDLVAQKLRFHQNALGAVPSPFDSYMCQRGMKTLHVRMQRSIENATKISAFLESHAFVDKVSWPFLKSHPQHAIAREQQSGGGMVVTFWIHGNDSKSKLLAAETFLASTRLFICAESLGAVESLAEFPAVMTHASVPEADRARLNIDNSLIRLSVGIEDVEDLVRDLDDALSAAKSAVETAAGLREVFDE